MVSTDRGPEMKNAMVREMMAVMGVQKREGLPNQPTFQAQVERDHLESKLTFTCILCDLASSFPTEWEFFLPAVEYFSRVASSAL